MPNVEEVLGVTVSIEPGKRTTEEFLQHLKEAVNAEVNPILYMGIDPGKHNGVCIYDAKFYLMQMFTVMSDDMVIFLDQFDNITTCVIEDYRLFPNKAKQQIYSDMETSRVIGRVEAWAERGKIRLIKQPSKIKPTGYAWLGKKPLPKSNSRNHELDAHVHFMYWAIKTQRVSAQTLIRR